MIKEQVHQETNKQTILVYTFEYQKILSQQISITQDQTSFT